MIKSCILFILMLSAVYTASAQSGDKTLPTSGEELAIIAAFEKGTYKYSVEDFFARPKVSSFQISPDGIYFSFSEKDNSGKSHVYVKNIKSGVVLRVIEEKEELIRGYYWLNNKLLLYYTDKGGDENYKLFVSEIEGSKERCLTPYENVSAEVLKRPDISHPDEIIVLMNKDNPEFSEPYSINIISGETRKLFNDTAIGYHVSNYYFNKDWEVNAYIKKADESNKELFYRTSSKEKFKEVTKISTTDKFEIIDFAINTSYPHDAYIISNHSGNTLEIFLYDLVKGQIIKKLFSNDTYDLSGLGISKVRKNEIDYYTYVGKRLEIVAVSPAYKNIHLKIKAKIGDCDYLIYNRTSKDDKYLLDVYSDKVYHKYYMYDVLRDELTLLVNLLPHLKEEDMAENRPIQFTSRDGLIIDGYLILPKGVSKNNQAALLVNPHGGPFEVRNEWGFNREAQLFASRGYATLQVNVRGSGGYGKNFQKAGYKQIGRKMLDDIEDGVNYVLSTGLIDEKRVAIYGGSYGGLAALGSLIKTPDLYACAVDIVGISSLFTFYASFPANWKGLTNQIYEQWYNPAKPEEERIMKSVSPVLNADKINKPLFIAHGANDPRVSIKESDQMVRSLRSRGVDVPYMVKYNEGHGFSRENNRIELYKTMLGFFAKYLK
jgi:dipeptidyl aminopeptidase/acylaminoacyl peptidase